MKMMGPVLMLVGMMGLVFSLTWIHTLSGKNNSANQQVLDKFPSDGSVYNELHRYYGDCDVFGDISSFCYTSGYDTLTKEETISIISTKYSLLTQGQLDVCNMTFNKATYDQFMGIDPQGSVKSKVSYVCKTLMENLDERDLNENYGGDKVE